MGLFEPIREGAIDLFGLRNEMDSLREAGADAQLLARKAENLGWDLLNADTSGHKEPSKETRKNQVERAYNYFYNDPIVAQAVNLVTWYTFGRGVTKPKFRDNPEIPQETKDKGQAVIDAIWFDEDNQACMTTPQAQQNKSNELQLQGNIFLLVFRSEGPAGAAPPRPDAAARPGPTGDTFDLRNPERVTTLGQYVTRQSEPPPEHRNANLKLTDIPDQEIVEIVTHPENRKIPVYYKREYSRRKYNFETGSYETPDGEKETVYYRDWKHEAPTELNGEPWGPPAEKIADGVIYHVKVNCVSDAKFGQSEVARVLKWAQGLNEYMTSRMRIVQAIAQIAMRVKTKGGPKQVSQVAAQLADISALAGQVEGSASTFRDRADVSKTKIALENQTSELQPMVQDTGASNAMTDVQTLKGQIAAGTGIPVHYLGDIGSANLATATAMELPVLKMMEARQELWEGVFRDLIGYALQGAGLDPEQAEVQMPPILARDVTSITGSLAALLTAIDPQVQNAELIRFVLGEYLDASGKVNTEEILNKIFPPGWKPPPPPTAVATETQAQTTREVASQRADVQQRVAQQREETRRHIAQMRHGTDRAPSDRGGTAASTRAASARQDRAAGRVGQSQSLKEDELIQEAPASKDEEMLASMPGEIKLPTKAALEAVDVLMAELLDEVDEGERLNGNT